MNQKYSEKERNRRSIFNFFLGIRTVLKPVVNLIFDTCDEIDIRIDYGIQFNHEYRTSDGVNLHTDDFTGVLFISFRR